MENELNKQTVVEWLFKQLWDEPKDKLKWYAILKHAKEMEKHQFGDIWDKSLLNLHERGGNISRAWEDFNEYYAITYGKTFLDLVSDEESKVHEVVRKLKEKKIK